MKAIFEVEFDPLFMCDEETLKELYNGNWFKCIYFLYQEGGLEIFNNELKLIRVIKK